MPFRCIVGKLKRLLHDVFFNWDILFTRLVNDWEVGSLQLFLGILYSIKVNRDEKTYCVGPLLGATIIEILLYSNLVFLIHFG